jgi:conjugal transfer ATP-binding protein TraC
MKEPIRNWVGEMKALFKECLGDAPTFANEPYQFKKEAHDYPSFSELLPYRYYDPEAQFFINQMNVGLVYEVTPLTGANVKVAEQLDSILRNHISHDYRLQVLLVKNNKVGHYLDAFSAQFSNPDFEHLNHLGASLRDYYQDAALNGFKTKANTRSKLAHTRCFVVVDKAKKKSEQFLKEEFGRFRISFESALSAAQLGFRLANAEDLVSLVQLYFDPDLDSVYPKYTTYDPSRLINQQLMNTAFDIEIHKDYMELHGVSEQGHSYTSTVTSLTLDELPEYYRLSDTVNNSNNIHHPDQCVPCNHIISVTYQLEEPVRAQNKANRKTWDLDKKSKTDYAVHVAGTTKQATAWRTFREDLAANKTRACKMLYNVLLFSKPEQRVFDVEAARSAFKYNGLTLMVSRRLQLPYFLASLPFLYTNHLEADFSKPTMMFPISSWNATQYMPLLSDWHGTGRGILLPTVRDQFSCIDPFSGVFGTNFNIAVTGTSGGGKSFFIQMLLLNVLFNGGDVFIIDVGGSYRKLCEVLGGVYLEYSNLAMNPFTQVQDIGKELDDIIALFELLACPRNGASDDDRGTLREAILNAFLITRNETCIDNVQQALLHLYEQDAKTYPTARILAKNLEPYTTSAEHGMAFNAPSQLDPKARFIVVDLKEIENNQSIRAPVLLSVLSQFQRRMFSSDRSRQKMCIIDEAWSFFTGDAIAAQFITRGFRTGRRHKASFVTITQGIEDYYDFSEARAAWENSALKLIFLQEHASLIEHQKIHQTFSEHELSVLKAFPKARDAGFSQVLVKANGISSFHRLFVDPFTKVLLSSDGDDYQAVMNEVARGTPYLQAVQTVAQQRHGLKTGITPIKEMSDAA